jgi:mycothiol synthase
MNINTDFIRTMVDQRAFETPGITLRPFEGETDYPKILNVSQSSLLHDGQEPSATLEDIVNTYTHLHHSDPSTDMLFVEAQGTTVGYSRVWWEVEGSGKWVGFQLGYVHPEWRHKGIGSALLSFNEQRLQQIACELKQSGELPVDAPCELDNFVNEKEEHRTRLLEKHGYQPVRYAFNMVRPDLENIPNLPLPDGVDMRPAKMEHLRQIWEASNEAFRDHWGYIPDPWEQYEQMTSDPDFDPSLWRVAWDGDQIAGMVLSFINKDENELYGRKRGYTENICVRRPWRRHGLAKALIAQSLLALKERGMSEAGLGVDSQNISGALNLYLSMGYQVVRRSAIYRKTLDV